MKPKKMHLLILILATIFLISCSPAKNITFRITKNYKPDNQELYDTIARLDSIFFAAYNTCSFNLEKYGSFYSDNIEFYHDQAGLNTSKQDIINGTKQNICGKVTRELIKGSVEVYPIKDFGAIEFGLHKFHNNQEPEGSESQVGRFVIIWEHINNEWKIKRVISLH
jgi:hypothetical protein